MLATFWANKSEVRKTRVLESHFAGNQEKRNLHYGRGKGGSSKSEEIGRNRLLGLEGSYCQYKGPDVLVEEEVFIAP